jgi:hypothetical protein
MYDEYGKHMHKNIGRVLEKEDIFLLYSEEHEFRNIFYEFYSKLIKKYPFFKKSSRYAI